VPIRILLDQNAPIGLRHLLSGYDVATAPGMGWSTIQNGDLIKAAEEAGFTILITCDQNIRYQQNLSGRRLALIELSTNHWAIVRDNSADLFDAIDAARPGSYATVTFPRPPLRRRPFPPATS
jgi:hypothetical protein